jgi:hypothetical protein
MAIRKLGELSGVQIKRIVKPVGVRLRCEFLASKVEPIEFEISGDLALAFAKEMENLLPDSKKRRPARPSGGKSGRKSR